MLNACCSVQLYIRQVCGNQHSHTFVQSSTDLALVADGQSLCAELDGVPEELVLQALKMLKSEGKATCASLPMLFALHS